MERPMYPYTKHEGSTPMIGRPEYLKRLNVGQRVLARWQGTTYFGVVSSEFSFGSISVQFAPCGCHYSVDAVSAYGNADGWTNAEYRIAREEASTMEHAALVEAERRKNHPDGAFSSVPLDRGTLRRLAAA